MACNTSNIKEMKYGRPQTVMFEGADTKLNGSIVTLGDTMEGAGAKNDRAYDHVHAVTFPQADVESVVGKFIIVAPEINEEEYRLIDGQISKFVLRPNVTYSAYELKLLDRIEYTEEYFNNNAQGVTVGSYLKINAQGKFEVKPGGNAQDSAFRVVSILDTHLPFVMAPGQQGQPIGLLPAAGKKIKLEVVR